MWLIILVIGLAASLINIDGYPIMVGDEGIYVSQAWSLVHNGILGPYTYWYDHFPLGWATIGLWQAFLGDPTRFGLSVITGRIFMALIRSTVAVLIYQTIKNLKISKSIGFIASLIFLLSPLSITFGRQVLLDNLAAFWLALTFYLLSRKSNSIWSSLTITAGVLSKESTIFILPIYFLGIYWQNSKSRFRRYHLLLSLITVFCGLAIFPLLAFLKGELLPGQGHVSLFGTILFQAMRVTTHLPFWDSKSDFGVAIQNWLKLDPTIILLGFGSTLTLLITRWQNIYVRLTSLSVLAFSLFLIRGGLVYDFYLTPILPLLSISIALLLDLFVSLSKFSRLPLFLIPFIFVYYLYSGSYLYTLQSTKNQRAAFQYINEHPEIKNNPAAIDNYLWLDLVLNDNHNFSNSNVHWYSKIAGDPTIQQQLINNDPHNLQYLLINPELSRQIDRGDWGILKDAKGNMKVVQEFTDIIDPQNRPYTQELLSLYGKKDDIIPKTIITINKPALDEPTIESIKTQKVWGIYLTQDAITNSQALQDLIAQIVAIKDPATHLFTIQVDGVNRAIPWITTQSRNLAKSQAEITSSTIQKLTQIKKLGFDALIVATTNNQDGYLDIIINTCHSEGVYPILIGDTIPTNVMAKDYLIFNSTNDSIISQQ